MWKKSLSIVLLLIILIIIPLLITPNNNKVKVIRVISPLRILLDNSTFTLKDYDSFDANFSNHNKVLANANNISETEAFVIGNLGKYWAENLILGRNILIKNDDLIFNRFSYRKKFENSAFCIKNSKPCSEPDFQHLINDIRKSKHSVLDLDTERIYKLEDKKTRTLKNFIIIKTSHLYKLELLKKKQSENFFNTKEVPVYLKVGDIEVFLTDFTKKLKPDRNCSTNICREILNNINSAKESVDLAIYGYSSVPDIEKALVRAKNRGVKIRLVYDVDANGGNIYENTRYLTEMLTNNMSDLHSIEADKIMHNKFYIFDNKILITGSANLSHTDMSGFNTNAVVKINSKEIANIYKQEFEQMYNGKFHNEKNVINNKDFSMDGTNTKIRFSPIDKSTTTTVLPLINNAKKYIYIPTFVLTDKKVVDALINAKNRGVEIKVIIDALNASAKYSQHEELRKNGISVKTENYAGKLHSKSMIIDDKYTIIGSMNFSKSGENKNDENLILFENSEIAKFYKQFFLYQWNKIDDKWLKYNAKAEGHDSIGSCSDGIDNNYDGFTDLNDKRCK